MAPVDNKLQYQVNKLIKKVKEAELAKQSNSVNRKRDNETYKAQPDQMMGTLTTEDYELNDEGQMVEKSRTKYVAPKMMSTLTTHDK